MIKLKVFRSFKDLNDFEYKLMRKGYKHGLTSWMKGDKIFLEFEDD